MLKQLWTTKDIQQSIKTSKMYRLHKSTRSGEDFDKYKAFKNKVTRIKNEAKAYLTT